MAPVGVYLAGVTRPPSGSRQAKQTEPGLQGAGTYRNCLARRRESSRVWLGTTRGKMTLFIQTKFILHGKLSEFSRHSVINCVCVWSFFNEYILVTKTIHFLLDVLFSI